MSEKRYVGSQTWEYRLPQTPGVAALSGTLEIPSVTGNYREDEGYARYHLRKKLKLARLPKGTTLNPWRAPS